MDKRTLLFVISLSLSLMLINAFFDYQNQDTKTEWLKEQTNKSKQKILQLEKLIEERTVSSKFLPLVELYSESDGSNFINNGLIFGNNILTTTSNDILPTTLYTKTADGFQSYQLSSDPKDASTLAIFSKSPVEPLNIGYLSKFGQHELQAITFSPEDDVNPYSITVAEYVDGQFSIPAEEVTQLKSELNNMPMSHRVEFNQNTILLLKNGSEYLPVALYNPSTKKFTYLSDLKSINTKIVKPKTIKTNSGSEKQPEKFYVLENDYQQLVFSNYGGALAEINLPFESEKNKNSVVKEISFDREMVEEHPYNAYFPAHPFFTQNEDPEGPFVEHERGQLGGYYPLIRRDLIEIGTRKSIQVPPRFYTSNIVSEYSEVAEMVYEVTYFDKNKIVFESNQDRRRITKTYSINSTAAPYSVDLTVKVEGDSRGLWMTTGVPEVELISDAFSPALKYRITRGKKSEVKLLDLPTESTTITSSQPDWICNSNGFFGIILDPLTEIDYGYRATHVPGNLAPSRLLEFNQNRERYSESNLPGYEMMVPLWSKGGTMQFRIFAGPFSTPILNQVDTIYSDPSIGYNPDYIACQTFHGWFAFISEPFAKFLFLLMNFFHSITGSWAFSIVLLTVALRIMMYPLNAWSTKSMLKTQQYMPKIQAIQHKYKNDPKKAQLEVLNFYKEQGINPLSGIMGGCFPLLIQMPFLIGMFDLLKSSFQLRGASFIPGWIDNLSAPDVLFSWNTHIPLIGNELHVLPIILGIIMFFQPRLMSPLPADKSEWSEQQRQQRAMGNIMAVMFTWLFYNFPSGLNIYWISSMLLGMLQQWWNKRNLSGASIEIVQPKKKNISPR